MKRLLAVFFLCLSLAAQTQEAPVQWTLTAKRSAHQQYILKLQARVPGGWQVYAANQADEIGAPYLSFATPAVTPITELEPLTQPVSVQDAIFQKKMTAFRDSATWVQTVTIAGMVPATLSLRLHGFIAGNNTFLPIDERLSVSLPGGREQRTSLRLPAINLDHPQASCGGTATGTHSSLFTLFLLGFLGGLIALLTPCVFPMIPVTVSFFTNRAATRRQGIGNALTYSGWIVLIYALASLPFYFLDNISPQIFNTIATSAAVNLVFFAIFIAFALSFFGVFELALPPALANTVGSRGGIFFMALTLATVSFSCTGPILGSLLVSALSTTGGPAQLTAGLFGFGLALALPFGIFALFPQALKNLPKSGSWLTTVKKSLAFVELALALKFLSNADLVQHWGLLKREVFLGLWILIALALGLYLLGAFRKKEPVKLKTGVIYLHQPVTATNKISGVRRVLGILSLLFAAYLVPGLTATAWARLPLVSGFPPPLSYSLYQKGTTTVEPAVINDFERALRMAKSQHKPLLIDFTGWACVNCRKMEEQVWTDPSVSTLINHDYVLVSLYVDDRKRLPAAEQMVVKTAGGGEASIQTVGDKYAAFQAQNFRQVTQPLYAILSPEGELLNRPVGYTPTPGHFKAWLECGLSAFSSTTGR